MSALAQPSARLANIERLRLLAMFEIVAFHTGNATRMPWLGAFGLPTFLLLGSAFSALAAERRGAGAVLSSKLRTVGGAWMFWSVVYGAIAAMVLDDPELLARFFTPLRILGGVRMHLWFAPFAVFAGTVAAYAYVGTRSMSRMLRFALLLAAGTSWIVLAQRLQLTGAARLQWVFALPSIPLGMALAELLRARGPERTRIALLLLAWCALAALISVVIPVVRPEGIVSAADTLRRYALSTALISATAFVPSALDPITRKLAPYMLGVYFVHVLVRDLLLPYVGEDQLLASLAVYAASIAVVEGLSRTPLRRYVVMTPSRARSPELTERVDAAARAD